MAFGIIRNLGSAIKEKDTNIYLYKSGDECTSLTGGWEKKAYGGGSGTLTKNSDHLLLTQPSGQSTLVIGLVSPTFSASILEGKTLKAEVELSVGGTGTKYIVIGTLTTYSISIPISDYFNKQKHNAYTTSGTYTPYCEMSGATTNKVFVDLSNPDSATAKCKIYKVWLE